MDMAALLLVSLLEKLSSYTNSRDHIIRVPSMLGTTCFISLGENSMYPRKGEGYTCRITFM